MSRVDVESTAGTYPVRVGRGFAGLAEWLPRPGVLVTEERVAPLWADAVREALGDRIRATVTLPPGEENKTIATWSRCVDALLALEVDRGTPVLALGGGVLGDVAGFAAATALRGLPVIHLPTTLLAMVDSSVGGKVAVNHPSGKNLVGAFHPPIGVWAALDTLGTLPAAELRCGFGEVLKTALVADPELLDVLAAGPPGDLEDVVLRCVRAKAQIVGADERESGLRAVLNAGHTVGHALETAVGPSLRHGEAVAIGLVTEARFAVRAGICAQPELPARLAGLCRALDLPAEVPGDVDAPKLLAAMRLDKKSSADKIRIPLPVRAGETVLVELPRSDLGRLVFPGPPRPGASRSGA